MKLICWEVKSLFRILNMRWEDFFVSKNSHTYVCHVHIQYFHFFISPYLLSIFENQD